VAENRSYSYPGIITRNKADIQWDEKQMLRHYANRSKVACNREEISVLFGVEQVRQPYLEEIRVALTKRIVMRPLIAKQFFLLIDETVRKYESIWGTIELIPMAPVLSPLEKLSMDLVGSGSERSAEKARALIRPMSELNEEIAFERSFKALEKQLLDNRFLLGINCKDLENRAEECLKKICRAIGMPQNMFESFMKHLPDANHVYFGFEENEKNVIYKGYLEFRDTIEEKIKGKKTGSGPFLLYLGLKWDPEDSTMQSTTKYEWFPSLPVPDILSRLRLALNPDGHGGLLEIAGNLLEQVSERISYNDIQYLEVSEEDNPRRSFDINVYKAQLVLKDLYSFLMKAADHFSIPYDRFKRLYDRVECDRFGHLAGGVDRRGRDFITVYHGVKYFGGKR
jgi:hypothetical protein